MLSSDTIVCTLITETLWHSCRVRSSALGRDGGSVSSQHQGRRFLSDGVLQLVPVLPPGSLLHRHQRRLRSSRRQLPLLLRLRVGPHLHRRLSTRHPGHDLAGGHYHAGQAVTSRLATGHRTACCGSRAELYPLPGGLGICVPNRQRREVL